MPDDRRRGPAVTLAAHAKLTLSLRVIGVRADGLHLIDAEMTSIDLHDRVTIEPGGSGMTVTGPYADGVPTDDRNLAVRALGDRQAALTIDKRIPHGGGLGGGSADAAAVLRWADHPTDAAGLRAAASLGADIAFCLIGGRARVRGIGEIVEPLPHVDRTVTLVIPPLRAPTSAVYRAWDDLGGPTADGANDLEPAALRAVPTLARWRDRIGELTGHTPILAGSGATWFVHGEHVGALAALGNEGADVMAAQTVPARQRESKGGSSSRS